MTPTRTVFNGQQVPREVIKSARTYYVNPEGNDSFTGLSNSTGTLNGAFLTIQQAINVVASIDTSVYDVTIQLASGTYNTTGLTLKSCVGAGVVKIQGDLTTPSNVTINSTGAGIVTFTAPATNTIWDLYGFKLTSTATGTNVSIYAYRGSFVRFGNLEFAMTGWHLRSDDFAIIQCLANYSISSPATYHINASGNAVIRIQSRTITITGTPAFTIFIYTSGGAYARCTNLTFSGSATGQRYSADLNSVIDTAGGGANYFPGDSAGATVTGGQYV